MLLIVPVAVVATTVSKLRNRLSPRSVAPVRVWKHIYDPSYLDPSRPHFEELGKGLPRRVKNTYFRNIPSSELREALAPICITSHIDDPEESLVYYHHDDDGYSSADERSEPTARKLERVYRYAQRIGGKFDYILYTSGTFLYITHWFI